MVGPDNSSHDTEEGRDLDSARDMKNRNINGGVASTCYGNAVVVTRKSATRCHCGYCWRVGHKLFNLFFNSFEGCVLTLKPEAILGILNFIHQISLVTLLYENFF